MPATGPVPRSTSTRRSRSTSASPSTRDHVGRTVGRGATRVEAREPPTTPGRGIRSRSRRPNWAALEHDYALIRQHIAAVIPGFEDFEASIDKGRTLFLPNGPRDERRFATADGKARFTVNPLEYPRIPRGRLLLQTLRSHDQYNTTIYGKDDRYRGIHGGRRVVMVNPKDIQALGFAEGEIVDLVSEWAGADGVIQERRAEEFRIVGYSHAARQRGRVLPRDQRARAARLGRRRQRNADVEVGRRAARAPRGLTLL